MTQLRIPTEPLHVAIVGSRDFPYPQLVTEYVHRRVPVGSVVISGGARGPDKVAEEAARARADLPEPRIYIAAWRRPDGSLDRAAGMRRNHAVVKAGDRVVAFWYRQSGGTGHTLGLAQGQGKPVEIWYAEKEPPGPWSFMPGTHEVHARFGISGWIIEVRDLATGEWIDSGERWWAEEKTQEAG